ncbi:MAG: hypothetical protein ACLP2J_12655 [Acidimicrobiales bacterium]
MALDLVRLTNELSDLVRFVEAGYEGRDLDQVRANLDDIRTKALQIETIVASDRKIEPQSGSPAWLTARSAEYLLEQSSVRPIDWDTIGACLSFLQTGIVLLAESMTESS